jgi:thioredoxin reductase (NADPH)
LSEDILDIAIIGGGPAGLSAGIYAARGRMHAALFDEKLTGGMPAFTEKIENYPGFPGGIGGAELMERMREQAASFGLRIYTFHPVNKLGRQGKEFLLHTDEGEFRSLSVVIATGMRPAKLGIPGEEELLGRGVSYCATCDGAFFKEKEVAVVGGGNAAVEEALYLTRFASRVYIIHRRDRLRASKILQERALNDPRIKILWRRIAIEVVGENRVNSLLLKNLDSEEVEKLPVEGVFFYVGNLPNSEAFQGFIDLDEEGFIVTDERLETSRKGIFAAGDVRSGNIKQVAVSVGEGATAAIHAQQYVEMLKGTAYI